MVQLFRVSALVGSFVPFANNILMQVQGPTSTDWISYLLNGGPFAIVVFLLVTDRLTTPGERDRLRLELTASHEREERLNVAIRNDFVPSVTRSIEAMSLNRELVERAALLMEKSDKTILRLEDKLRPLNGG